jgi:hypothetical protein
VPTLHPDFYRTALSQAGKPTSQANVLALAEFTAWNLTLNAHRWFEVIGDRSAQALFKTRFDSSTYEPERLANMPDDMIDFLWAWNQRVHLGLQSFVASMTETLASKLQEYGDDLPMSMWEDE